MEDLGLVAPIVAGKVLWHMGMLMLIQNAENGINELCVVDKSNQIKPGILGEQQ